MPDIRLASLTVPRTARYAAFGPPPADAGEWWVVLHGYGQLAGEFLAGCRALDDGRRLVVAPEALNRFYDTSATASTAAHTESRVGATWMTREDRENEIADYVRYLDLLIDELAAGRSELPPIHVLAFSQATATAVRWVVRGRVRPVRLVLWGGMVPPEVDLAAPDSPLRRTRVQLVVGSRDIWATPERIAGERARLDEAAFPYEGISFTGGHRLDDSTLAALAAS
jgi:predicted esterase